MKTRENQKGWTARPSFQVIHDLSYCADFNGGGAALAASKIL